MPTTKLIGIGGYGDFVLSNIYDDLKNITTDLSVLSINTDSQSQSDLPEGVEKINISESGNGAGANPERGYALAQANRDLIKSNLEGVEIVFLALGLGKGTGSGAGLYVAELCKELCIYTVACIRTPEKNERDVRLEIAADYSKRFASVASAICTISNETVLEHADQAETISQAYARGNTAAFDTIRGLTSIVTNKGEQNVDLEDFKATIQGKFAVTVSYADSVNTNFSMFELDSTEGRTALTVIEYPSASSATVGEVMKIKDSVRNALSDSVNKIDGRLLNPNIDQTQLIFVVSGFEKTLSEKRREAGLKGLENRYNLANSSKTESEEVTALQNLAN